MAGVSLDQVLKAWAALFTASSMRVGVEAGACPCTVPFKGLVTENVDGVLTHSLLINTVSVFKDDVARERDMVWGGGG